MRYLVEVRSQKSVGSGSHKFGGPDTYVAVQCVPDGVEPLKALNARVAAKRGIEIEYFGEGYYKHQGPRSSFGQAFEAATVWAQKKTAEAKDAANADRGDAYESARLGF